MNFILKENLVLFINNTKALDLKEKLINHFKMIFNKKTHLKITWINFYKILIKLKKNKILKILKITKMIKILFLKLITNLLITINKNLLQKKVNI